MLLTSQLTTHHSPFTIHFSPLPNHIIMTTDQSLKSLVKEKYSEIAGQSRTQNLSSCCGATGCCGDEMYNIMAEDYTQLDGYVADADLGLGCGIPTAFAQIRKGDTVIDLGSGAGNDAFVARQLTGAEGKVIGIDFTEAMIEKARENAEKLGYNNVEFRFGDIEKMPVTANKADVIISNCVLNLVPNKQNVFAEMYRVLKPGGHFSISDIVIEGPLPDKWRKIAEFYAGCISGAIQKQVYMELIRMQGFTEIVIQKEKDIIIPEDLLAQYLSPEEINEYRNSNLHIKSITVFAAKPQSVPVKENGCKPGSGCC